MASHYLESEFVFCDLQNIYRYIRRDDEAAARRFLAAAYDTFESLAERPLLGRVRSEFGHNGLRSWRVERFRNYVVFYRLAGDTVEIWRVLHGSRDLASDLD